MHDSSWIQFMGQNMRWKRCVATSIMIFALALTSFLIYCNFTKEFVTIYNLNWFHFLFDMNSSSLDALSWGCRQFPDWIRIQNSSKRLDLNYFYVWIFLLFLLFSFIGDLIFLVFLMSIFLLIFLAHFSVISSAVGTDINDE